MESADELSRHELLALMEIRLTGRTSNSAIIRQLLDNELIVGFEVGYLQLKAKGRRMLVRGSPSLWDVAS